MRTSRRPFPTPVCPSVAAYTQLHQLILLTSGRFGVWNVAFNNAVRAVRVNRVNGDRKETTTLDYDESKGSCQFFDQFYVFPFATAGAMIAINWLDNGAEFGTPSILSLVVTDRSQRWQHAGRALVP
jgi:hypothetical protein